MSIRHGVELRIQGVSGVHDLQTHPFAIEFFTDVVVAARHAEDSPSTPLIPGVIEVTAVPDEADDTMFVIKSGLNDATDREDILRLGLVGPDDGRQSPALKDSVTDRVVVTFDFNSRPYALLNLIHDSKRLDRSIVA